ncbi:OTU-like cysteine protease [Rhizodiscina lignyota]|uniref:OTU-like cysteine protease n=1 Tax=Rhizodiscina lignyota TaxID=1504668 RepID=A0A9P4I6C6_9PEZI|nr:OTU-like cysteine protease [Rhizodiscina lignyota]
MEELQARHRKEQRDLVAKITQKKKAASKKTRKGVNDECADLERELKERHEREIAALNGDGDVKDENNEAPEDDNVHRNGVDTAVEQLSITPKTENGQPSDETSTAKKPNRAKARLARRAAEQEALAAQAAEEAANMPDLRELEKQRMNEQFKGRGLQEKVIRADGHCLYSAVADQLDTMGIGLKPRIQPTIANGEGKGSAEAPAYKTVRAAAAEYIQAHSDDFVPFLEEPLEDYVHKVRDTGEWGGQLELLALAKTYGVGINVIQGDGRIEKIDGAENAEEDKNIWLAYYRHGFGLGEHYNSLRKAG